MWLSNAPGVRSVCSLACWTLGSDQTPTGFIIRAEASIGELVLTQPYYLLIEEY